MRHSKKRRVQKQVAVPLPSGKTAIVNIWEKVKNGTRYAVNQAKKTRSDIRGNRRARKSVRRAKKMRKGK